MTIPPSLPVSSKIIIRFRRRASINDARRINCAAARTFCVDLDSSAQIIVKPRELNVVYYGSDRSPCACFADGVATATQASVGQRTLTIAPEKAPIDDAAVIVIRPRQGGVGFKYTIPVAALAKLSQMNKEFDPRGRYDAVMSSVGLFQVELAP